jgi:hypothetical protein
MKCPLSKPEVTEKVIEFIRKFPVLYDESLTEFRDTRPGSFFLDTISYPPDMQNHPWKSGLIVFGSHRYNV